MALIICKVFNVAHIAETQLKKRIASPGLMYDTGCLQLVHWDEPEGWDGEGCGRRVQDGEHMYMEFRKMSMTTLYARQQKRHRCVLLTDFWTQRERGRVG